jgi:hypothetical protein
MKTIRIAPSPRQAKMGELRTLEARMRAGDRAAKALAIKAERLRHDLARGNRQ